MERSRGITILAWMLIAGSVLNTASSFISWLGKLPAENMNPALSNYFYYIASPFSIFVGVFLLKLRSWARTAVLILSVLVAVETIASTPYVWQQLIAYDPQTIFLSRCVLSVAVGCSVAFNIVTFYYFTRPHIKRQFQ